MSFHTFRSKDGQWIKSAGTPPVTPTTYCFGYILE